jgi:hypothetical protein
MKEYYRRAASAVAADGKAGRKLAIVARSMIRFYKISDIDK